MHASDYGSTIRKICIKACSVLRKKSDQDTVSSIPAIREVTVSYVRQSKTDNYNEMWKEIGIIDWFL